MCQTEKLVVEVVVEVEKEEEEVVGAAAAAAIACARQNPANATRRILRDGR
jgi:hypothetical protein